MEIRLFMCPKCRSTDVVEDFSNAAAMRFGVLNRKKCEKCGYSSTLFPELPKEEVDELIAKLKKEKKVKKN